MNTGKVVQVLAVVIKKGEQWKKQNMNVKEDKGRKE